MKIGLLAASAAAVLLVGALLYWRTSAGAAPAVHLPADASAAKSTPPSGLSTEARLDEPAAHAVASESRTAEPGAQVPAQEVESALPPMGDMASGDAAASIDSARASEYESFARKYHSSSVADRKQARETIEAMLLEHKSGLKPKTEDLTDDQALALSHELEWLEANSSP